MAGFYKSDTFLARTCLGYLVARAHNLMRQRIETSFGSEDVTFSQWRVLMCLRDDIARTCADISRELSHDSGSLTRLVDQLEHRGLIKRTRDKKDRRVVTLALTQQGRAAVNSSVPKVVDHCNRALEDFTVQESKVFIGLLTRLVARLKENEENDARSDTEERAA